MIKMLTLIINYFLIIFNNFYPKIAIFVQIFNLNYLFRLPYPYPNLFTRNFSRLPGGGPVVCFRGENGCARRKVLVKAHTRAWTPPWLVARLSS